MDKKTELKLNEYPLVVPQTAFSKLEECPLNQFGRDAATNQIKGNMPQHIEVFIYAN